MGLRYVIFLCPENWSETKWRTITVFIYCVYDDLVKLVNKDNIGCRIGASCKKNFAIFLYADDIILLAPSVQALQLLVNICISELNYLDMAINVKIGLRAFWSAI